MPNPFNLLHDILHYSEHHKQRLLGKGSTSPDRNHYGGKEQIASGIEIHTLLRGLKRVEINTLETVHKKKKKTALIPSPNSLSV